MAKRESTFVNMVMALVTITLIASASLGFIYELTKEPIERAAVAKRNEAIASIVPEFDNDPSGEQYTIEVPGGELVVYPAKNNGELQGVAIETFTNRGFSGEIRLMVGILPDGTINGIEVLEHRETPGLGDKIETDKSDFHLQFKGENPKEDFQIRIRKDGGDVDAITATTISSRAYCDAVERAWSAYMEGDTGDVHELPSKEEAINSVIPEHGNNPVNEEYQVVYEDRVYNVYPGRNGRRFTGTAIESYTESGYIGPIRLLVGFDTDGTITGVEVLEHEETPGYGDLIENTRSDFYKQFVGTNPAEHNIRLKEDGGIIDAISGATATSKAYCEAVRIAYEVYSLPHSRYR
ncbi:MAG: RnfABCDGE type electron transport complex subunit G [Bacteroidales bacterium]